MALRLMEITLAPEAGEMLASMLDGMPVKRLWHVRLDDEAYLVRVLIDATKSDEVTALLEKHFVGDPSFNCLLLPVEAVIPRSKEGKSKPEEPKPKKEPRKFLGGVSKEELYQDCAEAAELSPYYLLMVGLSALVAAIGLLTDNLAVIIGAMVIAPFLGVCSALSLSATLGDVALGRRGMLVLFTGVGLAFGLSWCMGALLDPGLVAEQILMRTRVGWTDLALALAAGAAGILSMGRGGTSALVGVMVAVALLPPLVAAGLLAGQGSMNLSLGAWLLFCCNLICINLAGVAAFLAQGIGPTLYWEKKKARKSTLYAIAFWLLLMLILVAALSALRFI